MKYLLRRDWPAYLAERHGVTYSRATFSKLATVGGGPRYVLIGNKAASTPEWLDAWFASKVGAARTSTSEAARSPQAA